MALLLFASALIDYDYIMKLIATYSTQDPKKLTISREQLIGLIQSDAKFVDDYRMHEAEGHSRKLTDPAPCTVTAAGIIVGAQVGPCKPPDEVTARHERCPG